jgi:hypothetical protein
MSKPTVTPVGSTALVAATDGRPYMRTVGEPQRYWRHVDVANGQLGKQVGACTVALVASLGMSITRYRFEGDSDDTITAAIEEARQMLEELDRLKSHRANMV